MLLLLGCFGAAAAGAITVPEEIELPAALRQEIEQLDLERYRVVPQPTATATAAGAAEWSAFQSRHPGTRNLQVDERTGVPLLIAGEGIPLVPGSGNRLGAAAFGPAGRRAGQAFTLDDVAAATRGFIAQNRQLLAVEPQNLVLDKALSVGFGADNRFWSLRYQLVHRDRRLGPIPVRDAHVFLRISHGNLVQLGNRLAVTPRGIDAAGILSAQAAEAKIRAYFDDPAAVTIREAADDVGQRDRTLEIVPYNAAGGALRHQLVRTYLVGTEKLSLELWLDAHSGELVHAVNRRLFVDGTVRGGIYPVTNTDPEVLRGMPYLDVVNDGVPKTTDFAGVYDYSPAGTLATATFDGDYVSINDNCGASSLSTSVSPGDISFGAGAGTDCDTPGYGGAGNTHAARSTYYHLNLIKEKARAYLGASAPWLDADLVANVNINNTCNAYWDPGVGTVNFYRSGGGCANTGEVAAVFLHEFGHGLDQNTGGAPSDEGSGEAYGDTMAFLQTHDPCIGDNFWLGVPCDYGCTSCSGVRNVSVTPAVTPATIDVAPADCDRWTCPYLAWGIFPYQGPMGYEGHCESLIASGAVWDMIQGFVGRYGPGAGWALADRIWYESLFLTDSAYQVVSGGQCNPSATVDGCGADNWYTVFLALDDDNGNLADGTPNADLIWTAFDDHGIACGASAPPTHTDCPTLTAPTLTATPVSGQVDLGWTAVTGAASYRVFRNSFGCGLGFTPIAEVTDPTVTYSDTTVDAGSEYFYAVQAVGTNDLCVSAFSTCTSATVPDPLVPADIIMVLDESGSMAGSTDVSGEQKIDALQDASLMVVDLVEDYAADGFRLGAVSFSTVVTGSESLKDLSVPAEKTAIESFVNGLGPTNRTAIGLGINQALTMYPGVNDKVLMLLSDGIQNEPPYLALKSPPPGAEVGSTPLPSDVRFYTVALGTAIQADLFDDLANQGGIPGFYYSGGTTDIQTNFAFWIADVLGLDPGSPFAPSPFAANPSGDTSFVVNRTVRRVSFLLTWTEKGTPLSFHLETPAGRIDPPADSYHPAEGYAAHTVSLPLPRRGSSDHVGLWQLVVRGVENQPPPPSVTAYALYDDPALSLDYEAGGADPGAGEPLPLEVRITENGQPLSGLTVRVAVDGPGEGVGEILSAHQVRIAPPAAAAAAADPAGAAAQKLEALVKQSPELFEILQVGAPKLTEASPGVYRGTLAADRTGAAGTYELTFEVDGTGRVNDRFARSQRFSRYLRLKPAPAATEVRAEVITGLDLPVIRLMVTPRDANGKRLGPGWSNYLRATSSVGSFAQAVDDNLDGSYTLELYADPDRDPRVRVEVIGEPVVDGPVSSFLPGGGRTLELGSFVGRFSFDSGLPIDDGPVIGARLGISFGARWSLETEIGITPTDDVFGNAGVVLQVGENVLYHLLPRPRPVEPFLTAGVGALLFTGFADDDSSFAFNYGGGVKLDLWPDTDLRLEARDYVVDDAYGSGTTHNLQLTAGLVFVLP